MSLTLSLTKSHTYILSVSGGVDSMSLFHYLKTHDFKFVAVHFDHQKRTLSKLDGELIESLCSENQIPYHYIKLSIKSGNFQDSARQERYRLLQSIADQYNTPYILTAHHADDQIETIMMKLIRGSNLLGYSGMYPTTKIGKYTYLKPLLGYSKEDLYNYAKENNVQFNEDSSNQDDDYLRNRIRHHVTPLLKKENDVLKHFNQFSIQSRLASEYIRNESKQFLNDQLTFKVSEFLDLHPAIQYDVLSYLLEVYGVARSFDKLDEIIKQLKTLKPNIVVRLSKSYEFIKFYDEIKIAKIDVNQNIDLDSLLTIYHNNHAIPNNSIELCYNELDFPLKVRHREKGDTLAFPYGHKKLKVFLIEKKIPLKERSTLKIVVDQQNRILWIPGIYLNQTLGKDKSIYLSIKE